MKKLITISREYGSGGRIIGEMVAKNLDIPFYDKNIIDLTVEESGFSKEAIEGAELKAKSSFAYSWASAGTFSEVLGNSSLSMNDKVFLAQFKVVKDIGEKGEGVIVGRCADYVLRDIPDCVHVFVYGSFENRVKRSLNKYKDAETEKKVKDIVQSYDKARKNYYDFHTGQEWGKYTNYDICINTDKISEEDAAMLITEFIKNRK